MKHRNFLRTKTCFSIIRNSSLGATLVVCVFAISIIVGSADGGGSDVVTKIEANLAEPLYNGLVPRGEAETKTFLDGNRKFEVAVTNVNLPDGTILNVLVDGFRRAHCGLPVLEVSLKLRQKTVIPFRRSTHEHELSLAMLRPIRL